MILSRLRFDNTGRERILRLIRYHDMPVTADRKLIKRLLSKHGEEAARQLIELHRADTLGLSESYHSRVDIFEEANAVMDELLREDSSCFALRDLAINGNDVMAMGFKGKQIGQVLQSCLDAVLEERIPNERGPLLSYAQEHNAD